jgi:hypothetical protein
MKEKPEDSGDLSVLRSRALRREEDELVVTESTLLLSLEEMDRGELIDLTPQGDE